MRIGIFFLLAAWISPTLAHSVHHRIDAVQAAIVLTLSYGNGQPFAHEKYALYADKTEQPAQTGHTDADGRVIFVPASTEHWRIKAQSAHGHGLALDFTVPSAVPPATTHALVPAPASPALACTQAPATTAPNATSLALFGFSLLFGGFGAYQLVLRRRTGDRH